MEPVTGTQRFIPADLFTSGYRIVGKIASPNTGLTGLVNDQFTSFMEISDARLARLPMPTKLVEHYEVVRVVKPHLFAICLSRREDLGPQGLARGGFMRLVEYPLHIVTDVYEVMGTIEWAGRFDFSTIMIEGTRDFLPIYNATLTAILIPSLKVETPAMLINRRHLNLLGLRSQVVGQ